MTKKKIPSKNALFPHNRFSTHFFSMTMTELGQDVLVSCIIDFDDIPLCLRQFCLNLNICKVMTIFFKVWPKKIRKTVITLQILRFKRNWLSQSWISSKSIMELTKSLFQNSVIFIEKKWVENQLWGKSAFLLGKRINSCGARTKPEFETVFTDSMFCVSYLHFTGWVCNCNIDIMHPSAAKHDATTQEHFSSPHRGSRLPKLIWPTKTSAAGAKACASCSAGTYAENNASSACSNCFQGTYQTGTAEISKQACLQCELGKYQTGFAEIDCTLCVPGKYQTGSGLTAEVNCTWCVPGKYQTGSGLIAEVNCTWCVPGKYQTGSGLTAEISCTWCLSGYYQTGSGLIEGVNCLAGQFQPDFQIGTGLIDKYWIALDLEDVVKHYMLCLFISIYFRTSTKSWEVRYCLFCRTTIIIIYIDIFSWLHV